MTSPDDQHSGAHEIEDHDRGLSHDLPTLRMMRHRRTMLGLVGAGAMAAGGVVLARGVSSGSADAQTASAAAACAEEIPTETAGPYPGDGSNGPDVLDDAGVVRRDIRRSFGDSTTLAVGVPLSFELDLVDTSACAPAAGLAVYAWHCNASGEYSMYSQGIEDENYLRGVQISGAKGRVRFRSIYPACYSGRWPHIHFEVYASRRAATSNGTPLVTSQLALPRRTSMHVYRNDDRYAGSEANLNRVSLRSDGVFGDDGGQRQLATMTGSLTAGYRAVLEVPVDV